MKTKKKVNLEAIRVHSFVTSLENDQKSRIKGGVSMNSVCCPDNTDGPTPNTEYATCVGISCVCNTKSCLTEHC